MDALTSCFDRSEARRIEGEERAPAPLEDPVPCPAAFCEDGMIDDRRPWQDPQQDHYAPCERCDGHGQVARDSLDDDEQEEALDMLREQLPPTRLIDDLQFDDGEAA